MYLNGPGVEFIVKVPTAPEQDVVMLNFVLPSVSTYKSELTSKPLNVVELIEPKEDDWFPGA